MEFPILEDFKKYLNLNGLNESRWTFVTPYLRFCQKSGYDHCNMTYSQLQDYALHTKNRCKAPNSFNIYIHAAKLFIKFLVDCSKANQTMLDDIKKIKPLKIERKIKTFVTKDELTEILQMAETFIPYMDPVKMRALLYFMFYTGLRKGEIINLRRSDIDLNKHLVIVKGPTKNKMERIVFFPKKISRTKTHTSVDVSQMLKDYFAIEGENTNAFNMNKNAFQTLFRNLKDFAPDRKFCPHSLRHSFARMLAKAGVDSRIAQKLLGHKNITTTMIYYDPDIDIIHDIYNEKIK